MSTEAVVAFIGTGVMGRSMAGHLLEAGYELRVYTRTPARAEDLLARGATWAESPAAAAQGAGIVISMVGYPTDVEECYLGAEGVLTTLAEGALAIDMTTSSPLLARHLHARGKEQGVACVDAPVSGGDVGAREATLSIMVGGEEDAFLRAQPVFEILGKNIVHQGAAGAGQHTKMCNQIANASVMLGVAEALAYAEQAGLDPQRVLESIASGAAGSWAMSNLAPRALEGDYAPGFFVKHFLKDMKIALESAAEMKLSLPGLALAHRLYEALAAEGGGEDGTQALIRFYREGKA